VLGSSQFRDIKSARNRIVKRREREEDRECYLRGNTPPCAGGPRPHLRASAPSTRAPSSLSTLFNSLLAREDVVDEKPSAGGPPQTAASSFSAFFITEGAIPEERALEPPRRIAPPPSTAAARAVCDSRPALPYLPIIKLSVKLGDAATAEQVSILKGGGVTARERSCDGGVAEGSVALSARLILTARN
jgi:hypothetical protein